MIDNTTPSEFQYILVEFNVRNKYNIDLSIFYIDLNGQQPILN